MEFRSEVRLWELKKVERWVVTRVCKRGGLRGCARGGCQVRGLCVCSGVYSAFVGLL